MKKLNFIFLIPLIFISGLQLLGQDISLKKNEVLISGKHVFDVKKHNLLETSFYKPNTKEELFYKSDRDDIIKYLFIEANVEVRTSLVFGSLKGYVKWLYENEIFDENGNIDEKKVLLLRAKYHLEPCE